MIQPANPTSYPNASEGPATNPANPMNYQAGTSRPGVRGTREITRSKPISTRMHGVLDYVTVGAFLAVPRVLGFNRRLTNAMTCLAVGKLGYTLFTEHELGAVKVLPMQAHLILDAVGGATLASLPFLCGEEDPAAIGTCAALGAFDIIAAPLTETSVPSGYTEEADPMAPESNLEVERDAGTTTYPVSGPETAQNI